MVNLESRSSKPESASDFSKVFLDVLFDRLLPVLSFSIVNFDPLKFGLERFDLVSLDFSAESSVASQIFKVPSNEPVNKRLLTSLKNWKKNIKKKWTICEKNTFKQLTAPV